MSRWLYDPETDSRNRKEFTYNLPIHENEDLLWKGVKKCMEILNH